MGVCYRVWIIPRQRAFRPTAVQVANLANALREQKWAPQPEAEGQLSQIEQIPPLKPNRRRLTRLHAFNAKPFLASWLESRSRHGLVLFWHVHKTQIAGVQYPFTFEPFPDSESPYYEIQVVFGNDYFYQIGETVMPFEEHLTQCTCGKQLAYSAVRAPGAGSGRIYHMCPQCARRFDPSEISCDVLDWWTNHPSPLMGGLTFRFALVVDCLKCWPREKEALKRFHLRPEFLDLWRTHIEVPFDVVATFD